MFSIASDYAAMTNAYGPFEFNDNKDGPIVVVSKNSNGSNKSVSITHVWISGR